MCSIVLAIVGNKCDLTDRIEVEAEEAEEYAKVQSYAMKKNSYVFSQLPYHNNQHYSLINMI